MMVVKRAQVKRRSQTNLNVDFLDDVVEGEDGEAELEEGRENGEEQSQVTK